MVDKFEESLVNLFGSNAVFLGKDIPVAGGYTLGQIVPGKDSNVPQLLNQHIVVIVFGEQ